MRTVVLLLALGFLWVACTPTTSPDEDCIVNGGICFTEVEVNSGCVHPISFQCHSGYLCCQQAFAANLTCNGSGNCKLIPEAGTGMPDVGPDVDTGTPDAGLRDAAHDAQDATMMRDSATEDAARDATASRDALSDTH